MPPYKHGIELNPGAQYDFVMSDARHNAYMGGRGAGKSYASVVRGLKYAQQPKPPGQLPPVGCLLAISFPQLRDIVYPALYLVFEHLGWQEGKDWREVKRQDDRKFILLKNGAEIKLRSLDEPQKIRGLNLAWFGMDEGRLFDSDEAYKILLACLRQGAHPDMDVDEAGLWVPGENYKHAGWVTSTPNGYDWMWRRFHPNSPKVTEGTGWYNASTYANRKHLPAAFIRDLEADYEVGSLFYRQEVLGEFVGAVHGAVWPMFDPEKHIGYSPFDPSLPLVEGWDFGIGDASVCLFAQLDYEKRKLSDGSFVDLPKLRIVGSIDEAGKTVQEFSTLYYNYVEEHFRAEDGHVVVATQRWGDPAGLQRQQVSGTSTIAAFGEHGIYITPARKRPVDEGIIIIANLLARTDGLVIHTALGEVEKAVQTYRWKVDDEGYKLSKEPIHDWTSHTCSALRYLALGSIGLHSRGTAAPVQAYERGTMGFVLDQLTGKDGNEVLMNQEERPLEWHPDRVVDLDGLFG